MKLTRIILCKMERRERQTNEFALKLAERIQRFRKEFVQVDKVLPELSSNYDEEDCSIDSSSTEKSEELLLFLQRLIEN